MPDDEKPKVKVRYELAEIADMVDMDSRSARRWLSENGVPIVNIGRTPSVWLADLAAGLPAFARSLQLAAAHDI